MGRLSRDELAGRELMEVFMASTLSEAQRAERVLTDRGVSYVVDVELIGQTLFGSPRHMAVFYVEAAQAEYCGSELAAAGLGLGVLIDHAPGRPPL